MAARGLHPGLIFAAPLDTSRCAVAAPDVPLYEGKQIFFLDGSGSSSDPRICRCGWGVAWLRHEQSATHEAQAASLAIVCHFHGGWFGCLGKEQHTVPRSEVSALHKVIMGADLGRAETECWTDCKYVADTFQQLLHMSSFDFAKAAHGSLWADMDKRLREFRPRPQVSVRWCKAHVETPELQLWHQLPPIVLIGN